MRNKINKEEQEEEKEWEEDEDIRWALLMSTYYF